MSSSAEYPQIERQLGIEAATVGINVLESISSLQRDEKLAVVPALISGIVYDLMGEDYKTREAGEILDALDQAQKNMEHSVLSNQWKSEETQRRSTDYIDE